MKFLLAVFVLLALSCSQNPPQWPVRFRQDFVQSYTSTQFHDVGTVWYDFQRQMQRTDRRFGKYDMVCASVIDAQTSCTQLVRDGKRFIVFPERRECCYCCDAPHGCGVLRRDWLNTLTYAGKEDLSGQTFNKFVNVESQVDFWAGISGKQIPRRLVENKAVTKDYIMNTYTQDPIEELIFALPSYCSVSKVCPESSPCTKFRG